MKIHELFQCLGCAEEDRQEVLGMETQKILPFGTPEEVRAEVLDKCEIFGKDGGFIFNTIHNVQARTPVENMVAMIDAVREFNGTK